MKISLKTRSVGNRERERKNDRSEMSTLSRSKVPHVWTPIIYRQISYPCQTAVSLWADLSSASLSALSRDNPSPPQHNVPTLSTSAALFLSPTSIHFHPPQFSSVHWYICYIFILCNLCFSKSTVSVPIVMLLMISHECKLWLKTKNTIYIIPEYIAGGCAH